MHHFATLIGYGASAVNPYLLLESLDELAHKGLIVRGENGSERTPDGPEAAGNLVKGLGKGLLKTISKMGISTIQSYGGAQIFEAVGLEPDLIERHFTGTASRVGERWSRSARHRGPSSVTRARTRLPHDDIPPVGGIYAARRRDGEHRMWNPETIALIQQAVRSIDGEVPEALEGEGGGASPPYARAPAISATASTPRPSTRMPPARRL